MRRITRSIKKFATVVLSLGLASSSLIACASSSADNGKTIKVAASATPHAEILEEAKSLLKEKGYNLEVTVFEDYVQPNNVVESGEFDANYMEHVPYLESFNKEQKTHLVSVGDVHYEPFGIYAGKKKSLDDIANGDTVAIPNDTTNEARALLLLQDNGYLKLKEGAGLTATITDIEENPYNLKFKEIEAAQISRLVKEVDYVVLNGNYALAANLSVKNDALVTESKDSEAATTYANVIVVKEGNEDNEGVKALVEVLQSEEMANFINDHYDGAVLSTR